ncbi:MAG: valyl-tRNA synthetase [Patescibacteria group bacterium]|nr:valyl-tRNA synthetase [Patescibacteria group bacterium]
MSDLDKKIELPKAYEASQHEQDIYKTWLDSGFFNPDNLRTDGPAFTISMPPPNATGILHVGHAAGLTIQDAVTRYKRLQGYKALWVPGTDHASIATQTKVEKIIAQEGTDRNTLGREKFLERVKQYVADSQGTIREQIRRMGSSCDWSRERYTFDDGLSRAVNEAFIRMYNDGLIYRGYRIVNWCPRCASTLADDEVEYEEQNAKLYYIKYGPFVVATTRPETKLADTGVAVHPDDVRYQKYLGQILEIDLAGHKIKVKVFADSAVDPEFGSGAIGVTPAHSWVDYEFAQKNNLEIIKLIDEQGQILGTGGKYKGLSVLEARDKFVADLQASGLIEKIEDIKNNLSVCYRCQTAIEPLTSEQWFVAVDKKIPGRGKSLK